MFEETIGVLNHGGPIAGHQLSFLPWKPVRKTRDRSFAGFKASEFKLGKKEKIGEREAQVIEYKLAYEEAAKETPDLSLSEKLWLDVETHLPLKRVVVGKLKKEFTCTEEYSEFTLNPKVDAKLFELPK